MDSSVSTSVSESNSHLARTKSYLLSLLSDSSQSANIASMSNKRTKSMSYISQSQSSQEDQKIHSAMNFLSTNQLSLSIVSSSSATSSSNNQDYNWERIQQILSQLTSGINSLKNYLNSQS